MERLIERSTHLHVTRRMLLDPTSLSNLKDVYVVTLNKCRNCFDDLLALFHNIPQLKRLSLSSLNDMDVFDLEQIHATLPHLTHLTVKNISAKGNRRQEEEPFEQLDMHMLNPNNKLLSIKIEFNYMPPPSLFRHRWPLYQVKMVSVYSSKNVPI